MMEITTQQDASAALKRALPLIKDECAAVLGSELLYQAVIYHCLRQVGVPRSQLGMNVKMRIEEPVSALFQALDQKKKVDFQGGFEPIPDICIFSDAVNGDWRRRNREKTLQSLLLAIEVKASERAKNRLTYNEIAYDIEKLAAHRTEAIHRAYGFKAVMLIIDSAPMASEHMTESSLNQSRLKAQEEQVAFLYFSPDRDICDW